MRRLVVGCLVALIVAGGFGVPVHAADEVGLSNDGVRFAATLPAPLFDPDLRWIPGDSETAAFYVRNQGPSSALLRLAVHSADTDELLANDDISLRARAAGGEWVELRNGVPSTTLTEQSLRQGRVIRVDVNAAFDPASTNQSQTSELRFGFDVTLSDSGEAPPTVGPGSSDDDHGVLPDTGAVFRPWQLALAAAMIVAGTALVRRSREREEDRV